MKSLINCTVTIMVRDIESSINFYVEILGLQLKKNYNNYYAEIIGPGLLLGIHPTREKLISSNNISIGFGVENFNREVELLKKKGIDFEVKQDGPIRLAHFYDLDNNPIFLAELKKT